MRVRERTPARTRAPSISDSSTSFHAPGAKYSRRAFRPEKIRAMKSRHCPRTGTASGTSAFGAMIPVASSPICVSSSLASGPGGFSAWALTAAMRASNLPLKPACGV